MLKDIVKVQLLGGYVVHLTFEDGVSGKIDLSSIIRFEGVFEHLRTPTDFAKVTVNPELGTICWPNGADLDPDVLYSRVTGEPLPTFEAAPAHV